MALQDALREDAREALSLRAICQRGRAARLDKRAEAIALAIEASLACEDARLVTDPEQRRRYAQAIARHEAQGAPFAVVAAIVVQTDDEPDPDPETDPEALRVPAEFRRTPQP